MRVRAEGAQLDGEVALWRTRTLDHIGFPYVFLDATYCKVRLAGRVVSQAVVIATGVSGGGHERCAQPTNAASAPHSQHRACKACSCERGASTRRILGGSQDSGSSAGDRAGRPPTRTDKLRTHFAQSKARSCKSDRAGTQGGRAPKGQELQRTRGCVGRAAAAVFSVFLKTRLRTEFYVFSDRPTDTARACGCVDPQTDRARARARPCAPARRVLCVVCECGGVA